MKKVAAALAFAASLLAVVSAPRCVWAQTAGWSLRQAPGIDLWYHALAVTGFEGFGRFPLYRPGYAVAVRRDREARGVAPTRLELDASRLLDAFQQDSAFEVVHFLPLYFGAADRAEMLSALARMPGPAATTNPDASRSARFGVAAASWALQAPRERRALAAFAAAAEEEWASAYGAEWRRQVGSTESLVEQVRVRWRAQFAPALHPYLKRHRLEGGAMILSASVGLDGRLLQGRSPRPADNVLVIGLPPAGEAEHVLFEVVRELCFPAVRLALPAVTDAGRVADEWASTNASVRCGDLMLARYLPGTRQAYQGFWLAAAGAPAVASLADVFPVPAPHLTALARAIEPAA